MSELADLRSRIEFRPQGRRIIHTVDQIMVFAEAVLNRRPAGVLVECGVYEGVSTARLSHLADMLDTTLVAADSFRGLPDNSEPHRQSITGRNIRGWFRGGALAASQETAQRTVDAHGVPARVRWLPGWFATTLPTLTGPIAGAYLDVDLAASTRTCLDCLWPLLDDQGVIVSQDGHLPLVIAQIRAWAVQAQPRPAQVVGLGTQQMVEIHR